MEKIEQWEANLREHKRLLVESDKMLEKDKERVKELLAAGKVELSFSLHQGASEYSTLITWIGESDE